MAFKMGISMSEFWKMTPYEFFLCVEGYCEAEEERSKQLIAQAYYVEAFARMKKLPKLKDLLKDKKKKQTTDEMLATVKKLNAMFGGEVNGSS